MTDNLDKELNWIYNLSDYKKIFSLTDDELALDIFDYPGGFSSFNAEMHAAGRRVISGDPAYSHSLDAFRNEAESHLQHCIRNLDHHSDILRENHKRSLSDINASWQRSVAELVSDYAQGQTEGRYVPIKPGELPFSNHQFKLALSTNLLSVKELRPEDVLAELCRVAEEVRIFPLVDASGAMNAVLGPIMQTFHEQNFGVEVREVEYEDLKGGNAMLRIWAKECLV